MKRRNVRLRSILALLVLATTLPLGLFAGWLIAMSWQQQQSNVDRQNIDTARAISVAIDKELESTIGALTVLASVDVLQARDFAAFKALVLRLIPRQPGWQAVVVTDTSERVLMNSAAPLERSAESGDWARKALTEGRPVVSDLSEQRAMGGYYIMIAIPVVERGQIQLALGAQLKSSALSEVLKRQNVPPNGVVTLIDARQRIIARTRNEALYVGKPPSEGFRMAALRMREGSWHSPLLEGTPAYSALSRSQLSRWTIGIGLPAEEIDGPLRRSMWALAAVGIAILSLGVSSALLLGHRIVRAFSSTSDAVQALVRSEPLPTRHSRIIEIEELSRGLHEAAQILYKRLRERDEAEQARGRAADEREQALRAEQIARAASRKDEARLAVTLHSIGDAVIAVDLDSKVTVINPVAEALTGWSAADAVGQPIDRVFRIVNEESRQPVENPVARVLREGNIVDLANHTLLIARDGREIPIADSAAPIRTLDQGLLGAVLVFRDVTRQRDAERERAALFQRELIARREAEAASRSKDEFVATVSHELRTPLNAIFGWAKLLRNANLDRTAQIRALDVIERNTQAQAQLIDDLLDMSRAITGNLRLEMRETNLSAMLQTAVETIRPTAEAKQLELTVAIEAPQAVVLGDPARLQQIAWNLLTNSIKFTPKGGRIEARVAIEDGDVLLSVSDTGVGIDVDFLPHVFERFRQGSSSSSRGYGGLGIGLALVRHLVELHSGAVTAHSEGKDRGARFVVRLPAIVPGSIDFSRTHAVKTTPAQWSTDALSGVRVLAVDDDEDARELIGTALREAGATVHICASMREALDTLDTMQIDVLLSDIAMPNGTGYELVRALRSNPLTANLPVIALTAYSGSDDRERALEAGFNFHVGKPFELFALIRTIAAATTRGAISDKGQ